MLISPAKVDAKQLEKMHFLIQLAIFAPIYGLAAWATILPAKSNLGSSQSKFFKCERDESLIIHGFFLIGLSVCFMIQESDFPAHDIVWLFVAPITILEAQFRVKNRLDKNWKRVFRVFIYVPLAFEIFL